VERQAAGPGGAWRRKLAALLILGALFCWPVWAAAAGGSGAVAFVGIDNNIYYCTGDCTEPECATCPVKGHYVGRRPLVRPVAFGLGTEAPKRTSYDWPTFSRDGKRLAYISSTLSPTGSSFALWVYDIVEHQATQIFQSRDQRLIYLYWLADGKHLSFLLTQPGGLVLMLPEASQSAPVRVVTTGLPLYFDWSPTSTRVLVHAAALNADRTEQVSLMSLTPTGQGVDKILSLGRSAFKAPCWSPDFRHLAYVTRNYSQASLILADRGGERPRELVSLPVGQNSFVWARDSRHIAYSTTVVSQPMREDGLVFHGIELLDIESGDRRRLTGDNVAAYFFSPNSRYLAYLAVPADKPYYTWKAIEVASGETRSLVNFVTTGDESIMYRFFEQYALSHTIWLPDSKAFVYAGVPVTGDGGEPGPATPAPMVWIVPIDGSTPRAIAPGTLVFTSPAPAN